MITGCMLQAGLLMVAAADGSVRVWRDYTYRGSQRLATAWQARAGPHALLAGFPTPLETL